MSTERTPRTRLALGALSGLIAGAVAVAVAELVSAVLDGVTSPLLSVANRGVDAAPRPVKEFAIETFGTADKPILIGSVIAGVAVLAMVAGALGVRRPRLAAVVFAVLVAVSAAAALADRAASAGPLLRLVPVLVMLLTGLAALLGLLALLRRPSPDAAADPVHRGPADKGAESRDHGKPRLLVERALPARVAGDDLPSSFDRRKFLVAAAAVSAVAAGGGLASRALGGAAAAGDRADLTLPSPADAGPPVPPGAELDIDGLSRYVTPNKEFYRVDTALQVPDVPIEGWSLRIHGMVDEELTLTFQDLLEMPLLERRITLTCVSNPVGGEYVGNAAWLGVLTKDLLEMAGVQKGADAVKSTSADDMTIGTPLDALTDDRGAMIALGMNGEPLPLDHGFPVRMVTPGIYGYVGATKWLVDLEVTRFADFEAYWTPRGYAEEAPIKISSRIDVPRSFARVPAGTVTVAGVAWSQDRGVTDVEVRVDDGPWQAARLADDDNINTWRQWVFDWADARPGGHTLAVRATDATGTTQTEDRAPIAPDGSSGWHSVRVTVEG